jgi:hypothetical protein
MGGVGYTDNHRLHLEPNPRPEPSLGLEDWAFLISLTNAQYSIHQNTVLAAFL